MSLSNYLTNDLKDDGFPPMSDQCLKCGNFFDEWLEECPYCNDFADTLSLDAEQRRDFDATVVAIADARRIQRECEAMWQQHDREEG